MVGTNGIADVGFLLKLLSNLSTIECVRHLTLLIGHFTDIVEQTCTLGFLGIESKLGSHHRTEVSSLTCMLQEVLTVRRTVFHLTDDADEFGVQTVDTEVDGGALTSLNDLVVELLLNLGYHLFNTCGVDTTIADQLMKGQTTDFTTDRIET